MLKAKRLATTGGGFQKTTKKGLDLAPSLASISRHWLTSQKVWTIHLLGKDFNRFLQLVNKGSIKKFIELLITSITTLKASISTIKLFKPSSLEMARPSLRAYNSAMKLLVLPSALA